ncbi:hypothetical protein HGO21_30195 [Acinetobacter sp. CUI P1]|nr:hypothetical protein [Acinetobacter sp. CUI P1]
MGEAKRKKLAGYVPEREENQSIKRVGVVGHGRRNMSFALAALLAAYPNSLPNWPKDNESTE